MQNRRPVCQHISDNKGKRCTHKVSRERRRNSYCPQHICSFDNCDNPSLKFTFYCSQHTTILCDDCNLFISKGNEFPNLCKLHLCNIEDCDNIVVNYFGKYGKYCYTHTCKIFKRGVNNKFERSGCLELKLYDERICLHHKCLILKCKNIPRYRYWCDQHVKLFTLGGEGISMFNNIYKLLHYRLLNNSLHRQSIFVPNMNIYELCALIGQSYFLTLRLQKILINSSGIMMKNSCCSDIIIYVSFLIIRDFLPHPVGPTGVQGPTEEPCHNTKNKIN